MSTDPLNAEQIFNAAREKLDAGVRAGYLEGACGNDLALRAKVEALLEADAEAGNFLEAARQQLHDGPSGDASLPDPDATQVNDPREQPGEHIGRYKLLQQIGEGGFGTVWMAEQREPVKRRVALKIIKLGMDTKQVIARFEAERQALAMMDHPNIARVFDAGSTDTGRPFFVMEYIKGVPIVEYCDTAKLDTDARLTLFTTTCQAIQHAHQKGIIHRDIKPSNVLVTLHDGKPVPKVIDFGIAKATHAELTSKTLFTEHRQMVGTPAYMSPEQAEMSGLDIDTRADIYSLGVLLYELLTGTTPFDSRELMAAGYAEMMRVICEEEPHKPSTRLSSMGDTGTRTAQLRHTSIKRLSLVIQGDLDWIVMKCLEKDRARRYDTATGLASDIMRHLSDEPVEAGPPSAAYKMQKFMKRNRVKVIVGGALAASLVLGVVGTSAAMLRAMRAEEGALVARDDARRAEEEAIENRELAESAKELIEQALEEKEAALSAAKHERRIALEQRDLAARETAEKEQALVELGVANKEKTVALELAKEETAKKSAALRRTRVLALTAASAEAANSDAMRALLLAREAGRTSMLPASLTQLHSAIQGSLERAILRGHEGAVSSAVFSPSGDRILTNSEDKTARLWDAEGKELAVIRGHEESVITAVFSPSGDQVLTAGWSRDDKIARTARLWDLQGRELVVFRGHESSLYSAAFSPSGDRILTCSVDKTARLWDLDGRELVVFHGHESSLYSAAFSPSGDRILTCSADETARLWDLEGRELAVFGGPEYGIRSGVISPLGDRILTVGSPSSRNDEDETVRTARLWDLEGRELAVLRGHRGHVTNAIFSPSGDKVLTCAEDNTARLWNLEGQELAVLRGHQAFLTSLAFSSSGEKIVTASIDMSIRIWDLEGKELAVLRGHEQVISSTVFSPFGDRILTASRDMTARLWEVEGKELAVLHGHDSMVWSAAYSPSGEQILTASQDKTARLWDLDGTESGVFEHGDRVRCAAFSPSGDRIVTGGGKLARLWDRDGEELAVLRGHESPVLFAGFSPSGDRVLTASHDATARLWDLEGKELVVLRGHEVSVTSAALSRSGKRILTASSDKTARLWDLEGKELAVLRGHESVVMSAVFSPSGDWILTASHDSTARLWDVDGEEVAVFRGHVGGIMSATFSPSGDRIVTGSLDKTARLWDLEGNELAVLRGNAFVSSAVFSPSGKQILTASGDAAQVWLVYGDDLLQLADERVSRGFTEEELRRYGDLLGDDTATDR